MENISIMEYEPLVTVAIPTFNRIDLLKRALASALAQNYKNIEIIVSDNASTDGTNEYLISLDDRKVKVFLNEKNLGMVPNWDRCLMEARGEYFLLMSDDDAFEDTHAIDKLVSGFFEETGKDVGAVFLDVNIERLDKDYIEETTSEKTMYSSEEIIVDFFLSKVAVFPCATLFRTTDLRDIGGYASFGAKLAVDACAWILVALKYGKIRRIGEPLVLYRIHHSLSSSAIDIWNADFEVMQRLIDKYHTSISSRGYQDVHFAMNVASSRVPISYIIRKYREDEKYNIFSAAIDLIRFRKKILSLNNIKFLLTRIFRAKEPLKNPANC